jgi:hypothetical protein
MRFRVKVTSIASPCRAARTPHVHACRPCGWEVHELHDTRLPWDTLQVPCWNTQVQGGCCPTTQPTGPAAGRGPQGRA